MWVKERESRLRVVWNNERGNPSESIVRCCLAKNGIIVLLQEDPSREYSLLATSSTAAWSKRECEDYKRAVILMESIHICKTAAHKATAQLDCCGTLSVLHGVCLSVVTAPVHRGISQTALFSCVHQSHFCRCLNTWKSTR